MSWTLFRSWPPKSKHLLAGLVGLAVETAAAAVPGVGVVAKIIALMAEKGTEDLLDPNTGKPMSAEQAAQVADWLGSLAGSYAGLVEKLQTVNLPTQGSLEQLTLALKQSLAQRDDLTQQFDACLVSVRQQTLSLAFIEQRLDEHFHVQQKVAASLEEIKNAFVLSPLMHDWAEFRKARPDALCAVIEADEHFLAGRREQGLAVLVGLLQQRGVGEATLAHHLGLVELGAGRPKLASQHLQRAAATMQAPPEMILTLTGLSTAAGKAGGLPVWRSLPRGFLVGRKYRIETEIGRGGMASVYRTVRTRAFEKGATAALKVPAATLMTDPLIRKRFEQEIEVSRRLSADHHPHIVHVLDYELFDDPHTGQELYALVMELVEGESLARNLARRKASNKPLGVDAVRWVMDRVCLALEHAHAHSVLHRDLKPHNVMVGKGVVKLMDFGIARVLDDARDDLTRTGQFVGSPAYLPPELMSATGAVDVRTDVYLAGNLLLEMLTLDPAGDAESRADCPPHWLDLIADSMNRVRGKRPASIAEFRRRLLEAEKKVGAQPLPGELINSIGMKLALIPAGTFTMGSPTSEANRQADEVPRHEVEIAKPFYLGVHQVTQEQYERVIGGNPSHFKSVSGENTRLFPVENVSWEDAVEFCKRLSAMPEEKGLGRMYRLPTEAEWEYSCRGGASSYQVFHLGDSLSSKQANFDGNFHYGTSKGPYLERTCKVGSYKPNAFGLYDMHGNVWEWCADWFDENYYASSPRKDPAGPTTGTHRVLRGGSWDCCGLSCRAARRLGFEPGDRDYGFGFRVVLVLPQGL